MNARPETNLRFAPGETNIAGKKFSPSVILFWLKYEIAVTNMRVVSKRPNTLLGLIPLGYADAAYPLNNVASAGVEVKFSLLRLIFGIGFVGGGFQLGGPGIMLAILGVSMILNAFSAALTLQNNGGGLSHLHVSVLEKAKLEQMRDEINQRLFADHAAMRHSETMGMHAMGLMNQQQQIQLMQGSGNAPTQAAAVAAPASPGFDGVSAHQAVASPAGGQGFAPPAAAAVAVAPPVAPVAPPASPAQWAADPFGRHQQRYWDGSKWTEHVSTNGQQGIDQT